MSPTLSAHRCPNGHLHYPGHTVCPDCGASPTETVDLSDREGTVRTWTTNTATPPGVREPNTIAIVAFEVAGASVQVIGQTTTDDIETGQRVRPVYVEQLRDPDAGIRRSASQRWDGYRFEPVPGD